MQFLQFGTVNNRGTERIVIWNPVTGKSIRASRSAGMFVENGIHDSLESAIREAERDIERGPRMYGDMSYRGEKKSGAQSL